MVNIETLTIKRYDTAYSNLNQYPILIKYNDIFNKSFIFGNGYDLFNITG